VNAMPAKGFTLFELLVVLVLVALIAAVSAPLLIKGLGRAEAKGAAQDVAAALRRARSEAVVRNADVWLTVDVNERSFRMDRAAAHALPAKLGVELYTAQTEQISADVGSIRFFPDGSSTGGEVVLADGQSKVHVQVEWLTGRVSVIDEAARGLDAAPR
jgi:general secretion pathway protein H